MKKYILAVVLLGASSSALSATCAQKNNKIGLVGLDSTSGIIIAALRDHDNACGCSAVRFYPDKSKSELALSILLAAKLADKTVRIDLLDDTDCDSAYRAYIQLN